MGEFFGSIYCIFERFFGLVLAEYMWGNNSPHSTDNSFIGIGLIMFAISLFGAVLYYIIIDKPSLAKIWCWFIFLGVNSILNFIAGWQWTLQDFFAGKMVTVQLGTNLLIPLNITYSDTLCFGFSNMLLSVPVFVIFSFIVKWGSSNCRQMPF